MFANLSESSGTCSPAALLTINQTAEYLGLSPRTVSRRVADDTMPAPVRIGGLVRWSREVLDQWIAEGCPRVKQQGGAV